MAPVRHAAHSLHAARPIRRAHVGRRVFLLLGEPVVVASVETLLEATAHRVPVLAERVTCDGFLGRDLDVVRQREPVVPPVDPSVESPLRGWERDLLVVSVLRRLLVECYAVL